ncbi:histidine kinase [Clostridia bacterium]|nr:histidine kinase [Clostridia bacterium]
MIRALRRKYIIVTTLLVALLLAVIFGALLFASVVNARQETLNTLNWAISARESQHIGHRVAEREQVSVSQTPAFTIILHADKTASLLWLQNVDRDAEGFLESLPELARIAIDISSENNLETGILSEYNLRFLISYERIPDIREPIGPGGPPITFIDNKFPLESEQARDSIRIAFVDTASESRLISSAIWMTILSFTGVMTGFFIMNIFIARWIVRPVERSWQQQQRFLADASHELKTPLTVILANMEILMSHDSEVVGQPSKWIENTGAEAHKMRRLVDQMLFLAKSDMEKEEPRFAPVNMSDLTIGACLTFESVAFDKEVTIDAYAITSNIIVQGDSAALDRLLGILLDNAVKFSPAGETVAVSLTIRDLWTQLTVRNMGEPLTPQAKEHLFERFYRADAARSSEGYGLGLAIAQSIVHAHHGTIRVESDIGGTVFIVKLPGN